MKNSPAAYELECLNEEIERFDKKLKEIEILRKDILAKQIFLSQSTLTFNVEFPKSKPIFTFVHDDRKRHLIGFDPVVLCGK